MILHAGPVLFRSCHPSDSTALLKILTDPQLMKLALDDRALSRIEAHKFLRMQLREQREPGLGTVCVSGTGEVVGFSGYRPCVYLGADDHEFGWVIAEPHQRRGYATALGHRFIAHALHDLNWPRVLAACHPANAVSEHILRDKLNMTFVADVRTGRSRPRRVYQAIRA